MDDRAATARTAQSGTPLKIVFKHDIERSVFWRRRQILIYISDLEPWA